MDDKEKKKIIDNAMNRIIKTQAKFDRIAYQTYLKVCGDPDSVSDGELIDATFNRLSKVDLSNPLYALGFEMLERLMKYAGIEETPQGINVKWFYENRPVK